MLVCLLDRYPDDGIPTSGESENLEQSALR
jgi:hypothetical protein